MIRLALGLAGIFYGVDLIVRRSWWNRFLRLEERRTPTWLPLVLALGAFVWSGLVLATGLWGALSY